MGIRDWFTGRKRGGGRVTGGRGSRAGGRARERERHQPTEAISVPGHGQPPRQDGYHAPAPIRSAQAPASDWHAPPVERQRTPDLAPRAPRPPAPSADPTPSSSSDAHETRHGLLPVAPMGRLVGILIAIEGDDLVGELFKLFDGENKLGRSKDCRVKLTSEFISREHALLIHQEGMFVIKPLKDENPVLVNGEKTDGTALQDGDLVRLGRTTFRFRTA